MRTPSQELFSSIAQQYQRFRPHYPAALFAYLASVAPRLDCAWDCGTGNGQAALGLADYFGLVVATDISAEQIRLAFAHSKVRYHVAPADHCGLPASSVDLVTVGEALHWFDPDSFGREVARVSRPGGMLAVWNYQRCQVAPAVDRIVNALHGEILAGHWATEALNDNVFNHALPLTEIATPAFTIEAAWSIDTFMGYLSSWSACSSYSKQHGHSPLDLIASDLKKHWPDEDGLSRVTWKLNLRAGTVNA